jgi:hypothetical protein
LLFAIVVEARNLVSMDAEGFANPYIVVTLGKTTKKTRVIRTTLNPKWRIGSEAEKFKLYVLPWAIVGSQSAQYRFAIQYQMTTISWSGY